MIGLLAGPIGRWALAALVLAFAVGAAWLRGHSTGLERGRAEVQARWNAERLRAQDVALRAQEAARAHEQGMAASVAAVADHYAKESNRAKTETADLRRRFADGSVRLTVPAACPGGGGAAAPAGGAGGGDGSARAELPRAVAEAVLTIGDDADAVTRQLEACQAVLRAERGG